MQDMRYSEILGIIPNTAQRYWVRYMSLQGTIFLTYLGLSDSNYYVPKDKKAVLPSNAKVVGLKVKHSPARGIV